MDTCRSLSVLPLVLYALCLWPMAMRHVGGDRGRMPKGPATSHDHKTCVQWLSVPSLRATQLGKLLTSLRASCAAPWRQPRADPSA